MRRTKLWILAICLGIGVIPGCQGGQKEGLAVTETVMESVCEPTSCSESVYISESTSASETVHIGESASTSEIVEEIPDQEITLCMVGDMLIHKPILQYSRGEDGAYDFTPIFDPLREEIREADIAIVNQEVLIAGDEFGISGYPSFNAPFALGDALVEAGFDVVCHGTNHVLDQGKAGLLRCLEYWSGTYPDVMVLGAYATREEADTIAIYEKNGIRLALLNYTYGTNGKPMPEDMPYAVDLLEKERVIQDIQRAEELADFTIVMPHWGTEYVLEETAKQKQWAQLFLEHGVDLVLGTHPHVIEPIRWWEDPETGHRMLVYYSLGNFVNWTSSTKEGAANRMVGGMAQVSIGRDETGQVEILEYGVTAVVTHLEAKLHGVYTTKLSEYSQELSLQNAIIPQAPPFSKEYCVDLCNQVWGDLWK